MYGIQVSLPESLARVRLRNDDEGPISEKDFEEFCRANPDLRVERNVEGEIVVMPPAGMESSYQSHDVGVQLGIWALQDGRGKVVDSSAAFHLPDGSTLSPDVAWVSNVALSVLNRKQRRGFPKLCPEFVIEVLSPSDSLPKARRKMEQWIANGARLGWLLDGDAKAVYVYRKGRALKTHHGISELAGEGPVKGFVLKLDAIWRGLA